MSDLIIAIVGLAVVISLATIARKLELIGRAIVLRNTLERNGK